MVQLKFLSIFILFASQKTRSELASEELFTEESKKVVLKTKSKVYNGKQFHCDLSLLPQQKQLMFYGSHSESADVSYDLFRWPKNKDGHVIVPYVISKSSQYSSEQLRLIRHSMDAIELVTCVRFKPRKVAKDYVHIFSGKYCKSNLGRTGGAQELSLNWKLCFEKGIIIHELLHALGYIHMHNRPDRDKYVKILWKNIDPRWYKEFDKVNPSNFNHLGTPYDYQSIMHYGSTAFTKNGATTILTKNSEHIGQRFGLSDGDIKRINNKYNCKADNTHSLYIKPEYSIRPFVTEIREHKPFIKPSSKPQTIAQIGLDDDDDDLFNI